MIAALDHDETRIQAVTEKHDEAHLTALHHNLDNLDLDNRQFDMIYARFVLMYCADSQEVLTTLHNYLKPGGCFVLEESTATTAFCYPENAAYQQWRQLRQAMGKQKGFHFDIGDRLLTMLQELRLQNCDVNLVQPVLKTPYERSMNLGMLKEYQQHYIDCGLCTQAEIDNMLQGLIALNADPVALMAIPRTSQVRAIKA